MFEEQMRKKGFVFLSGKPGVMSNLHRHREVEVNLIVSGEMEYLFGGSRVLLPAGQLAVFWAMIPHRVFQLTEGTEFYCVHLPLARFLQWQGSSELTSRLLHGEMVRERDDSWGVRDRALFEQWRLDQKASSPDVYRVVLLELEARLRRLAWSVGGSANADGDWGMRGLVSEGQTIDKVEQMAIYITEHYREPITTADISAAVDLHPNYAMGLFRDHCGMTLGEYLAQQRLSQAQRLLATTDAKVINIAFASGFGSVSQFYEIFTRFCGLSPKAFRQRSK